MAYNRPVNFIFFDFKRMIIKRIFFEDLTKDREESLNMLENPSMKGVQYTIVEKCSDQAHFIYQLLHQN